MCTDLKHIFLKAVSSVEPQNLLRRSVRVQENKLFVQEKEFSFDGERGCYVVGFGKAVLGMAVELEAILGAHLKTGIVTVPAGIFRNLADRPLLPTSGSRISYIEGAANNLPDEAAREGALEIRNLAAGLDQKDLLIVLISGGGSALLPLPRDPITLGEKLRLVKRLGERGANIVELNCVRKRLSVLKGGGLAKIAKPARVVSLILSDIVGDPLDFIASGPTVLNLDGEDDALNIIKKYELLNEVPPSICKVLAKAPPDIDRGFFATHVTNVIIGNNKIAAAEAKSVAEKLGYQTVILSTSIGGSVDEVGGIYAELVHLLTLDNYNKEDLRIFLEVHELSQEILSLDVGAGSLCVIGAGEPTVVVNGGGKGGRNQELALRFSARVNNFGVKMADISFLSCGTDGIDGPTDAAGALGTSNLVNNALEQDLNPTSFLNNNDSYNFYEKYNGGRDLIKTGHTGTNVMDLHVIIIKPKKN